MDEEEKKKMFQAKLENRADTERVFVRKREKGG